jgi:hypothetical protein
MSSIAIIIVAFPLLVAATIRGTVDRLDDRRSNSRFVDGTMRLVDRLERWGKR